MRRTTWRHWVQGAKTGLLDLSLIQTDKYEEALRQGISKLWAGEDPKKILDKVAAKTGMRSPSRSAWTSRRRFTARGPQSPAPTRSKQQFQRNSAAAYPKREGRAATGRRERERTGALLFVPALVVTVKSLPAASRARFGERNFKYLLIGPAIFVLLLIGIFPLVYLLHGELPGHHHDRDRHRFHRRPQLRAIVRRRAPVAGASAHGDFHRGRTADRTVSRFDDGAIVSRAGFPAVRYSSHCWFCRWWSRRSSPARPGR